MHERDPESTATTENRIRCPRCGYDQRGVVQSWRERCDLAFTCTECGLRISSAELLSPKLQRPQFCVEYSTGVRSFAWRTVRTVVMAHCPWLLWRRLKMSDPPRFGLVVLSLAVSATFLGVIGWTLTASLFAWRMHQSWGYVSLEFLVGGSTPPALAPSFLWLAYLLVLCPLGFIALPASRRRAKVRWVHITRVLLYSLMLFVAAPFIVRVAIIVFELCGWSPNWRVDFALLLEALVLVSTPPVATLFWQAAISRYLRMEHSWGVAVATVTIGFLVLAFIAIAWDPWRVDDLLTLVWR